MEQKIAMQMPNRIDGNHLRIELYLIVAVA
jgi:hypothetical protein